MDRLTVGGRSGRRAGVRVGVDELLAIRIGVCRTDVNMAVLDRRRDRYRFLQQIGKAHR